MIKLSGCKINIGLSIIGKREDGYHDLESIFYPLPFHDILEIVQGHQQDEFKATGVKVDGDPENNLVMRAVSLMRREYDIPFLNIHLHKNIPLGAGLGGGSANATTAIVLINNIFDLKLGVEEMKKHASEIGSDCPFFVEERPAFVHGRGTEMMPVSIDLTGKFLFLAKPDVHVSTAEAYAGINVYSSTGKYSKELIDDFSSWQVNFVNDFEKSIFKKHPVIGDLKRMLLRNGAMYASMSGSGASVFGIFDEMPQPSVKKEMEKHGRWMRL